MREKSPLLVIENASSVTPLVQRPAAPATTPRLGLSELDKIAASALATGDIANLLEQVRARAEALCGDERDAALARMLAKRIASTEAAVELLEAMTAKCMLAGNFDVLAHVERLLKTYSSRWIRLIEAHALQGRLSQRPSVVVGDVHIDVR